MSYQHAIVWMDRRQAKVIDFSVDDQHTYTIVNEHDPRETTHQGEGHGAGDAAHDRAFFDEVWATARDAKEILIVGPAQTKLEFRKHVEHAHSQEAGRIVGVEGMDHPTPGELLKHARHYFKKYDQVH